MSPLFLVGMLTITALSPTIADVKHVLEGSAHPPNAIGNDGHYHSAGGVSSSFASSGSYFGGEPISANYEANAILPGQIAFWWADAQSPFKAAYDHFKRCTLKGNCVPPVNPDYQQEIVKEACNICKGTHASFGSPVNIFEKDPYGPIDVKDNPFLNGQFQGVAISSCTGTACKDGKPQTIITTCKGTNCNTQSIDGVPQKTDFSGNPFFGGGNFGTQGSSGGQKDSGSFSGGTGFVSGSGSFSSGCIGNKCAPGGNFVTGCAPGSKCDQGSSSSAQSGSFGAGCAHGSNCGASSGNFVGSGSNSQGGNFGASCAPGSKCDGGSDSNSQGGNFGVPSGSNSQSGNFGTGCAHGSNCGASSGNFGGSGSNSQGGNFGVSSGSNSQSGSFGAGCAFGSKCGASGSEGNFVGSQGCAPGTSCASTSGGVYVSGTGPSGPGGISTSGQGCLPGGKCGQGTNLAGNPFFNGQVSSHTAISGNGAPVDGTNGFLGVQPSKPFGDKDDHKQKPFSTIYPGQEVKPFPNTYPQQSVNEPRPFSTSHPQGSSQTSFGPGKTGTYCKGPGYLCVAPEHCSGGFVNKNGDGLIQVRTDEQYCKANAEVCCRLPNVKDETYDHQIDLPQPIGNYQVNRFSSASAASSSSHSTSGVFASSQTPLPNSYNFEKTDGKSSVLVPDRAQPGSTIKFQGGAGLSPGLIHVLPEEHPGKSPTPFVTTHGETGSDIIRIQVLKPGDNQLSPSENSVFSSTVDYSDTKFNDLHFASTIKGPAYLPPDNSPVPNENTPEFELPYSPSPSTYQPSIPTTRPFVPSSPKPFSPQPYVPPSVPTPKPYVPPTTVEYLPPATYRPPQTQPTYKPYVPPVTPRPSEPVTSVQYLPPKPSTPFVPPYVPPRTPFPTTPKYTPFIPQEPSTYRPYQPPTQPPYQPSTPRPYQPPTPRPYQPPVVTERPYQPPTQRPIVPGPSENENKYTGYHYSTPTPSFSYPTPPQTRPTTRGPNEYLPPVEPDASGNIPGYLYPSPKPTFKPHRPDENPDDTNSNPSIVGFPKDPAPFPLNTTPHPGCAAALKCVQEIYCTAEGVISPVPVVLTKEQEESRVPTTECADPESGIVGKCCRDPDYKDPWPSANLINGVDDGQYREDPNLGQYRPDRDRPVRAGAGTLSNTFVGEEKEVCGERHRNTRPKGSGPIEANFAEIPWQAMVLRDTNRSLLCGGVIIKKNAVLTAAHCVEGLETSDILIKGGEWKLGIDEEPLPFQIVKVAAIIKHPDYVEGSLKNDLAVLILTENLRFAQNIEPLCIPPADKVSTQNCIVTGWGKRILQVHLRGAVMHSIDVNVLEGGRCQETLQKRYQNAVQNYSPDTLCCYSKQDQCDVDYGSALACASDDGHYMLTGIYSWDTGCKDDGQLGGYAVPDMKWINSILSKPLNELRTLERSQRN